jgi:RNA polymerase sigma-54 factor
MKQSLSLLQMPITELVQEISTYLVENPALESMDFDEYEDSDIDNNSSDESNVDLNDDNFDGLVEDLSVHEWDEYFSERIPDTYFVPTNYDDEQMDFEHYTPASISLSEHLIKQLKSLTVTDDDIKIGEEIIGNLTDDGYFLSDISEIAGSCCCTGEKVENVLQLIRTFEPAGIASSTLVECILAQLSGLGVSEGEFEQIKDILVNYSAELASYRYNDIIRKSGLDEESLNDILSIIRRTDPRPGLGFASRNGMYIVPDVYIVRNGDDFDVMLNEDELPPIKLNAFYLKAVKDKSIDNKTKKFMEEKLKNAVWVIKSLHKRQKAIYRVTRAIVDVQKDFLLFGEDYFKPLRLKDIASATKLHESTVSRVTSGKYALTEFGIKELKYFFSKGLDTSNGDTSTRKIKHLLKDLIDNEPANSPHSDEKLVKLLSSAGMEIARRTVAKYRDELNIPTMSQRRRMKN